MLRPMLMLAPVISAFLPAIENQFAICAPFSRSAIMPDASRFGVLRSTR
jgi:hypothetical protein